jgi:flagellar export protein FliJ
MSPPLATMNKRNFHFRLEPIRMLRKEAEQSVMKEFAGELACADELRKELRVVEDRLEAAHHAPVESMTAHELASRQLYVELIERQCAEAGARVTRQEQNVEHTRQRLATATQHRSMLDRLEGRRRSAYDAETRRVDAIEGGEAVLRSFLHAREAL